MPFLAVPGHVHLSEGVLGRLALTTALMPAACTVPAIPPIAPPLRDEGEDDGLLFAGGAWALKAASGPCASGQRWLLCRCRRAPCRRQARYGSSQGQGRPGGRQWCVWGCCGPGCNGWLGSQCGGRGACRPCMWAQRPNLGFHRHFEISTTDLKEAPRGRACTLLQRGRTAGRWGCLRRRRGGSLRAVAGRAVQVGRAQRVGYGCRVGRPLVRDLRIHRLVVDGVAAVYCGQAAHLAWETTVGSGAPFVQCLHACSNSSMAHASHSIVSPSRTWPRGRLGESESCSPAHGRDALTSPRDSCGVAPVLMVLGVCRVHTGTSGC